VGARAVRVVAVLVGLSSYDDVILYVVLNVCCVLNDATECNSMLVNSLQETCDCKECSGTGKRSMQSR
jgi:hypothetical protein